MSDGFNLNVGGINVSSGGQANIGQNVTATQIVNMGDKWAEIKDSCPNNETKQIIEELQNLPPEEPLHVEEFKASWFDKIKNLYEQSKPTIIMISNLIKRSSPPPFNLIGEIVESIIL